MSAFRNKTKLSFQELSIIIDDYGKQKYGLKKLQIYLNALEDKANPYRTLQQMYKIIYVFVVFEVTWL